MKSSKNSWLFNTSYFSYSYLPKLLDIGIRLNTRQNYWDDGNNADGDGWSSACSQEQGWTWTGGSATDSDTWTEKCGDGVRFNKDSNYWDDGNNVDGDGWSSLCSVESNWKCSRGNLYKISLITLTKNRYFLYHKILFWNCKFFNIICFPIKNKLISNNSFSITKLKLY